MRRVNKIISGIGILVVATLLSVATLWAVVLLYNLIMALLPALWHAVKLLGVVVAVGVLYSLLRIIWYDITNRDDPYV